MMASQPLEETGELAVRLAWRARKLGQPELVAAVEAACTPAPDAGPAPLDAFRFGVVMVEGDLVELRQWPELDDTAEPLFWRATVLASDGTRLVVAVSRVPGVLQSAALPVAGIRAVGFLVGKLEGADGNGERWLLAGHRLGWFPGTAPRGIDVAPGLLALAEAGFDVGFVDDIRRAGSRPLTAAEREAWRAFLIATSRLKPASWESAVATEPAASLADLFQESDRIIARPVTMHGTVKRITAVDPGEVLADGTSSARQLEVIVNTGSPRVAITNAAGERMEFGSRVLVTVVASEAAAGQVQEGTTVAIDGFAYRYWTYESGASVEQGAAGGQTLPLVMAWRIRPVDSGQARLNALLNWTMIGLVVLVGGVATTVWWMNRRDRMTRP